MRDDSFTHRTVSAAGAEPVASTAPNSVFAMGSQAPTDVEPLPDTQAQVEKTLEACGPLTLEMIAEALRTTKAAAQLRVNKLARKNRVAVVGKEGRFKVYGLPHQVVPAAPTATAERAPRGFREWLQRKGEPSAEGRQLKRRPPPSQSVTPSTPAAPLIDTPPAVTCGLFNTGDLVIEAGGQVMRLARSQVRELVAYLDRIAAALQAQ